MADGSADQKSDWQPHEPEWVTKVLWAAPTSAAAVIAVAVAAFISLMCYFYASSESSTVGWMLCGGFAALAVLVGAAAMARHLHRRRHGPSSAQRDATPDRRPTMVIVAFLISVYSLLLTIGLHIFRNFFANNRPGGIKYNVTVGIALASTTYMSLHGRSIIRRHFAAGRGRNITVSPGQAFVVIALLLCFGAYFAWIMG